MEEIACDGAIVEGLDGRVAGGDGGIRLGSATAGPSWSTRSGETGTSLGWYAESSPMEAFRNGSLSYNVSEACPNDTTRKEDLLCSGEGRCVGGGTDRETGRGAGELGPGLWSSTTVEVVPSLLDG